MIRTGAVADFFSEKKRWSIIKDRILECYLKPYLAKVLTTNKPLLLVDCFAGKGRFDDGEDGSPVIIAKSIQAMLGEGKREIQGVFIEKKYGKDLKDNLKGFHGCRVIEGTFEDNFEQILIPNTNVFIYIDPYGIKGLDFDRLSKVKERGLASYEMLMNFNSFGFLREACRLKRYSYQINSPDNTYDDDWGYEDDGLIDIGIKSLNDIADGDYWQSLLASYDAGILDMFRVEELFVNEYVQRFKFRKLFKYTVNIPVKLKTKNIPKYRLIFGTNHRQGLFLMCDNMNKQWNQILNEQRNGQIVFFEYDYPDRGIIETFDIGEGVLGCLSGVGYVRLEDLYCALIEKFGIAYSRPDYNKTLKRMEADEIISFRRTPSATPTGKLATSLDCSKYLIEVKARQ